MRFASWAVISLFVTMAGLRAAAPADYAAQVEAKRAERVQRLTRPDGWLTLIGLHFLPAGESTLGHAGDNVVKLAAGPARVGTVTLGADGEVTLAVADGVAISVGGKAVRLVALGDGRGEDQPVIARVGPVSFYVIDRGGKKALRVKDSAAAARTHFLGLDYFPLDPSWRVEAEWVPFTPARRVTIHNLIGQAELARVPGKAVFARAGRTFELQPMQDGPGDELFFVISDATSGGETYAAARFVYAAPPRDGKVVLDFNLAVNPPCAFTAFATCPLPPKENRLPVAVRAGEKRYRGGPH